MPARRTTSPMPIRNGDDALYLLSLACANPLEPQTLVFLLGARGAGGLLVDVSGTDRPDDVLDVVGAVSAAGSARDDVTSLVVGSVRPDSGVLPGDVDRWLEASSICWENGLVLLEWYVIGPHGAECPRELIGEPERWP